MNKYWVYVVIIVAVAGVNGFMEAHSAILVSIAVLANMISEDGRK